MNIKVYEPLSISPSSMEDTCYGNGKDDDGRLVTRIILNAEGSYKADVNFNFVSEVMLRHFSLDHLIEIYNAFFSYLFNQIHKDLVNSKELTFYNQAHVYGYVFSKFLSFIGCHYSHSSLVDFKPVFYRNTSEIDLLLFELKDLRFV